MPEFLQLLPPEEARELLFSNLPQKNRPRKNRNCLIEALDLDFIPLVQERYDLVFPQESDNSQLPRASFRPASCLQLRTAVSKLAGYDTSMTGTIVLDDTF